MTSSESDLLGSELLVEINIIELEDADLPTSQPTGPELPASAPRSRSRWLRFAVPIAIIGAAAGIWVLLRAPSEPLAHVLVTKSHGVSQMVLSDGDMTLNQLRTALVHEGHGSLLTPAQGGGYELEGDLSIADGAHLTISNTPFLLESTSAHQVRVVVAGGSLTFRRDTIASWNSSNGVDADITNGRAYIVAEGPTSRMDFSDSTVAALGSNADDPGVTWRLGAAGGISQSTFEGNFRGAYAYDSGQLTIAGSTFTHSIENGLVLLGASSGSNVVSSSFDDNASDGLEIGITSDIEVSNITAMGNTFDGLSIHGGQDIRVSGGLFSANQQYGIVTADATRVTMDGIRVWDNTNGVEVDGGATAVSNSLLSGNDDDGLFVTGPTSVLRLTGDRLDNNQEAGLWVADGAVVAEQNLIDENRTGVSILEASRATVIQDDQILDNSVDGIALLAPTTGVITGNTIVGNAKAAFSLAAKGSVAALVRANRVSGSETLLRIRG